MKRASNILLVVILTLICLLLYSLLLLPRLASLRIRTQNEKNTRNYHVIILGTSENISTLNQVYEGASKVADRYKALVELYVPSSKAEDSNLQSLFDYASFVNADGIIAYTDNESYEIEPPHRSDGEEIPVVTIGQFSPDVPQISFIGTNYSDAGRAIALLSIADFHKEILIINNTNSNNPNYSTLMNSLQGTLKLRPNISYELLDNSSSSEIHLAQFLEEKKDSNPSIVCLTEEDSIKTAQAIAVWGLAGKVNLICFGDNMTISGYLKNNLVSKLISIDPQKTGSRALQELFEYRNYGYANSYITADLLVRSSSDSMHGNLSGNSASEPGEPEIGTSEVAE